MYNLQPAGLERVVIGQTVRIVSGTKGWSQGLKEPEVWVGGGAGSFVQSSSQHYDGFTMRTPTAAALALRNQLFVEG